MEKPKYVGWIPNLRGRLSFSTIGSSTRPYPYIDLSDGNKRVLVQKRTLNDSAIPRVIRKILFEYKYSIFRALFLLVLWVARLFSKELRTLEQLVFQTGDFQFVYIQTKESSEKIEGKVYVLYKKEEFLSNKIKYTGFDDIDRRIKSADKSLESSFEINRNGIVFIYNSTWKEIKESELQWISPRSGDQKKEFVTALNEQIYFFLKDLCHEHQHHDAKSDSILPLIAATKDYEERLYTEVLKSLYRMILKKRRSRTSIEFNSISGILVYVKSFKLIMGERESIPKAALNNFRDDGDGLLLESISSKSNQLELEREKKRSIYSALPTAFTLAMSFLAIVISSSSFLLLLLRNSSSLPAALQNLNELENVSWYIKSLQIFLTTPPILLISLIILLFLTFALFINPWFWETKFMHDLKRLIFSFRNQRLVVIVGSLFGIILLGTGGMLLFL